MGVSHAGHVLSPPIRLALATPARWAREGVGGGRVSGNLARSFPIPPLSPRNQGSSWLLAWPWPRRCLPASGKTRRWWCLQAWAFPKMMTCARLVCNIFVIFVILVSFLKPSWGRSVVSHIQLPSKPTPLSSFCKSVVCQCKMDQIFARGILLPSKAPAVGPPKSLPAGRATSVTARKGWLQRPTAHAASRGRGREERDGDLFPGRRGSDKARLAGQSAVFGPRELNFLPAQDGAQCAGDPAS